MRPTKVLLQRARAVLTPDGAWTQGWFAKDKEGKTVTSDSKYATCFCAIGALERVCESDELYTAAHALRPFLPPEASGVPGYNDRPTTTQQDILALFDRAIEACK